MQFEKVEKYKLKNGAQLAILNSPEFKSAKITVKFNAGYLHLPNEKNQVPHLLEHIIYDHNEDVKHDFAKFGVWQNAGTWDGETDYWLECLPEYFESMIQHLLYDICNPILTSEKLTVEKKTVENELSTERLEPLQLMYGKIKDDLFENIISEHAKKATLKNIEIEDLQKFYQEFYTTDNARIFIYGHFSDQQKQKIMDLLENFALPRGEEKSIPAIKSRQQYISRKEEDGDLTRFMRVSHFPHFSNHVAANYSILFRYLFHSDSGNAYQELRKKGLIYGFYLGADIQNDLSEINEISFSAIAEKYDEVMQIVKKWVKKAQNGEISDEELDFLKTVAKNDLRMDYKDLDDRAGALENRFIFNEQETFPERVFAETDNVTRESLSELACEVFADFEKEN